MTGKVGPLPVWAWAAILLAVGYVFYRVTSKGSSSSSSTTASTDTTAGADTAGSSTDAATAGDVTAGAGPDVGSFNADTLNALGGLQSSVDSLTALVQSSPAFTDPGSGDSGSGSVVTNGTTPPGAVSGPVGPATRTAPAPAPATRAPAHVRYYTYAPGKAPKNRKRDEAPARGPAGTTLRFARGKGFYYA